MSRLAAGSAGLLTLAVAQLVSGSRRRAALARRPSADGARTSAFGGQPRRADRWMAGVVAAASALATLVVEPRLGVAAAGVTIIVALRHRCLREQRRRLAIDSALPDAIDLLVVVVHAGRSPAQTLADIAPSLGAAIRPAFDAVAHELDRGRRLADAVQALPTHLGPGAFALADAIAATDRHGLALGPVIERLAAEATAARRRLAEAECRRLPVRLAFPLVCCTLPSFVLLAIAPTLIGALSALQRGAP